jgi:hypothetical protein
LFEGHFNDLNYDIPTIPAITESASSPTALPMPTDEMLPYLLACEIQRQGTSQQPGTMHRAALLALGQLTDTQKLDLILRLELTGGMLRRENDQLKHDLIVKNNLLEDNLAGLQSERDQLDRVRDMYHNERDQLNQDRAALNMFQALNQGQQTGLELMGQVERTMEVERSAGRLHMAASAAICAEIRNRAADEAKLGDKIEKLTKVLAGPQLESLSKTLTAAQEEEQPVGNISSWCVIL